MKTKCIYCLKDKSSSQYQKREHVMPQCYGKFTPNNLILYKIVCDECNQYFGEKIELYLGRDTIEGVMRYKYGIKPGKLPKRYKRLKFKIYKDGELKGMIVMPKPSGVHGEIDLEPVMQVGFFKKDKQEYDYFELQYMPTAKELKEHGYELEKKIIDLITNNDEDMNYLLKVLKEKGMDIKLGEEIEWPEDIKKRNQTLVKGARKIDRIIYRGLSKIAFNYLAHVVSKDFVLLEDFNGIRNFIRYDEGNNNEYFSVNELPILYEDRILRRYNMKITEGHLIIVKWRGMNLISKISIFNMETYLIRFCRNFSGVWRQINYGHHFDINSKEVSELITASSRLIP